MGFSGEFEQHLTDWFLARSRRACGPVEQLAQSGINPFQFLAFQFLKLGNNLVCTHDIGSLPPEGIRDKSRHYWRLRTPNVASSFVRYGAVAGAAIVNGASVSALQVPCFHTRAFTTTELPRDTAFT